MKKRFFALILILALCMTLAPITVQARDNTWDYLLGQPGLKPGDLLRAGHPDVLSMDYTGFQSTSFFDWAFIMIQPLTTASGRHTGMAQIDWFIWDGDLMEFAGPPTLTYDDGTVIVGTHEILSDGEHVTLIFDPNKTSGRYEVFVPFRLINGTRNTHVYNLVNGEFARWSEYVSGPEYVSTYSTYLPSRPSGTGRVSDLITVEWGDFFGRQKPMRATPVTIPIPPAGSRSVAPPPTPGPEPTPNPSAPTEQPSAWAEELVNAAIEAGLVPQHLQSNYTQATTRAEFAALAVTLYENITGEEIETGANPFTDTSDINVQKAAAIGIIQGTNPAAGIFSPDNELTREMAATLLSNLSAALGHTLPRHTATFDDMSGAAAWAFDAIGQMQAAEIMSGSNNRFMPRNPYAREQSIITMLLLHNVVTREIGEDT